MLSAKKAFFDEPLATIYCNGTSQPRTLPFLFSKHCALYHRTALLSGEMPHQHPSKVVALPLYHRSVCMELPLFGSRGSFD
jgi:hypothetical protein